VDAVAVLDREARALVQRLRSWTPARFAADCPGHGTRGDVVHHLAQALADAAADLERRPRRVVPRLASDLGLADQLAVTAADLVAAGPPDAAALTSHLLLHRTQVLDDEVPAGLTASLGLGDVLTAGQAECRCAQQGRSPSSDDRPAQMLPRAAADVVTRSGERPAAPR